MTHPLRTAVADQIALFRAYDDDGSAKTDLDSSTTGLTISVFRVGLSSVSVSSLTNKAADDTTHADGAIRRIGGNLYSIDLPDAATATYCPSISVRGSYTGGEIEPIIHPLAGYDPSAAAVGALTTLGTNAPSNWINAAAIASNAITDAKIATSACNKIMGGLVTGSQPAGSLARFVRDIKNGDLLFEGQIVSATTDKAILDAGATTVCVGQAISIGEEGDAERQTRFVTAFDPATKEITLDRPWCVVPSNGADYQVKTLRNPLVGDRTKVLSGGFNEAIADTFSVLDTLTEDSSGLRYTAKALEQAPAGGSGTIIVQPIVGSTPERTAGATIRTFNGENYPATVSGVDAQGNVIDWTTLSNLEFVIDDQEGTDLAVIADANITKQTTFFSVVIPAAANIVPTGRNSIAYRWSIRNATSKVVALQGQVIVSRTALID
jgi:hypothetical protein